MPERKLPYTYICGVCGNKVSVISNTYKPVCNNKDTHSTSFVEMEPLNDSSRPSTHN